MAEKVTMARIYEDSFSPVYEKGITVVFRGVQPQKRIKVVKYFHGANV
jgi:hypothetical protein